MRAESRAEVEKSARSAEVDPLEIHIAKISELGQFTFSFKTELVITDEFRDKLMPNTTHRLLTEKLDAILNIYVVSADDEKIMEDNYMTWRVSNITSKDLTLQATFKEPS